MYKTELITSIARYEELREPWNLLADNFKNPLVRHEWFLCCARNFHKEGSLRIGILHGDDDTLLAAAPLVAISLHGSIRWELLGAGKLYEPCGFLYNDLQSLAILIAFLVDQNYPILLHRIESISLIIKIFKEVTRKRGLLLTRASASVLSLILHGSWEELLESRSANFRSNLKRKYSQARQWGTFVVELAKPHPANVEEMLAAVEEVEGSGWKGVRKSSLRHNHPIGFFFRDYVLLATEEGILRIALLKIGGKVVAVQLGIVAHQRFWVLKMGYDELYKKISPGFLLTAEVIRDAIQNKLYSYEFLGSAEPWEERWGPETMPHSLMLFYPPNVRGLSALAKDTLTIVYRRLFHHDH